VISTYTAKYTKTGSGYMGQLWIGLKFGIPEGRINSPNFLNQWGLDGGNRLIVPALRFVF
jgi:hypothetical protein